MRLGEVPALPTFLQFAALLALGGCTGVTMGASPGDTDGEDRLSMALPATDRTDEDVAALSAEAAETYLAELAPILVGRVLTNAERTLIVEEGGAIAMVLEQWATDPAVAEAARTMMETRLAVSGTKGDIDFNLPGNTVAHVVLDDLPWAEILTSDTCYTADNEPRACDTGAPYTAGVLTTRAFMVSRVGRFNLTRASTLMGVFACRKYPMEDDLQPRIDRARLIEMFRADNAEEQAEERAKAGFGNGAECYTCHGQFSLHAQPFVRFDKEGVWHQDATGLQSEAETAQLGESDNGLFTSHLEDPAEAASERTQFFGKEVENLVGVATELSASDAFGRCSVENVLGYVFNLDEGVSVAPEVTEDALQRARNRHYDFTFADLMVSTLSHPSVVFTTLDYFGDGT